MAETRFEPEQRTQYNAIFKQSFSGSIDFTNEAF